MIVAPKINCRPSFVIDTKSLQVKKMVMRCHGHHVIKSFCKTAKSKKQSKNESMKQVIQCIWFIRSVCAHQIFANHVLQQKFLSLRWKAAVFKTRVELALLCLATLSKRIKNHLEFEHPKNNRPSFSDVGGDFFPARQPCEDHKSRIYRVAPTDNGLGLDRQKAGIQNRFKIKIKPPTVTDDSNAIIVW